MTHISSYNKLINLTNKIILNKYQNFSLYFNPFFFIIKGNDYHFSNYKFLFGNKRSILIFFFKNIFSFFTFFFNQIFFFRSDNYENKFFLKKKIKYLFISHLINTEYLHKKTDFHFGKIPLYHKNESAIIYVNHLSNFNYKDNKFLFKNFGIPIYILINRTNIYNIFKIILFVFGQIFRLIKLINLRSKLFEVKVILSGIIKSFSAQTLYNYVLFFELQNILKKTDPEFIIFTYEGQAYEKSIISAAFLKKRKVRLIGYQNSPVVQHQNTLFLKFKSNLMPHEIWTSGSFCQNLLKKRINIKTRNLGSPKFLKAPLINKKYLLKKINKKITCLVTPEGLWSEMDIFLIFCINYCKIYDNIRFIFRLHPEISKLNLLNKFKNLDDKIDLLKISDYSLIDDFKRSDLILYRGTTVVTQAVKFGIMPIYLCKEKNDFNIDPLYSYKSPWKKRVINIRDLNQISIKNYQTSAKLNYIKKITNFSNTILHKLDFRVIKNINEH
jgi:hypothetical protein